MPGSRAELTRGEDLTDDTLDALYAIRATQVRLKGEVSTERDRVGFDAAMRRSTHVCVLTNLGRTVGFVCADLRRIHEPRDVWLMHFQYAFIEPEHRGGGDYARVYLRAVMGRLARHPRSELYYYGVAYLPSFVRTSAYADEIVTLHGPSGDPRVQLLEHLTRAHEGERWSSERGTVWMPTIPPVCGREWSRADDREAAARYESLNPSWREGYSLPILVRVDMKTVLSSLRQLTPSAFDVFRRARTGRPGASRGRRA